MEEKIIVKQTCIEIHNYHLGDNKVIEDKLSVWNKVSHTRIPLGRYYDEDLEIIEVQKEVKEEMEDKERQEENKKENKEENKYRTDSSSSSSVISSGLSGFGIEARAASRAFSVFREITPETPYLR